MWMYFVVPSIALAMGFVALINDLGSGSGETEGTPA